MQQLREPVMAPGARGRVARPGIRPPKFADRFSELDFESSPLPRISLYPPPAPVSLHDLSLAVCGLDCKPFSAGWPVAGTDSACAPDPVCLEAPLICQTFNWSEAVAWAGVRVADFLAYAGLDVGAEDYVSFFSRDGCYFEALPAAMALDERTLLATQLNGEPLPHEHGGPVRLVAPFLQGYKSVKWLGGVRVTRHDPVGTKRLLGQSKTGYLGAAWRQRFGIEAPAGDAQV